MGTIEQLKGSDPVCKDVLAALRSDFYTFRGGEILKGRLRTPEWHEPLGDVPAKLAGAGEIVFDFDNDGELDRVVGRNFESTYMHSAVLLVEQGKSAKALDVSGSTNGDGAWLLPCQVSTGQRKGVAACSPCSQQSNEAGFVVGKGTPVGPIRFRARYASVWPFFRAKTTFVGVTSQSKDTQEFVAVLKPLPGRTMQEACLFRRVPENF